PVLAWTLASGDEVRTRYDRSRWLPEWAELWRGGAKTARLAYRDYRKQGATWWPTRIEFTWPEAKASLSLDFEHPRFNAPVAASLFTPRLPDGVRVLDAAHPAAEAAP